jgi:hypothetical protein
LGFWVYELFAVGASQLIVPIFFDNRFIFAHSRDYQQHFFRVFCGI